MFDYYMAVIFLAIFVMCILVLMVQGNDTLDKTTKHKFYAVANAVIIASICEWSGVQLDGMTPLPWLRTLHILVKITEFSVAPMVAVICADIVGCMKHRKIPLVVLLLQSALEILSGFTGMIFYVDANNTYGHGTFYWVYATTFAASILYFVMVVLRTSQQNYGSRRRLPLMLVALCLCGLVLQYCGGSVRVIWLCTAIDVLLVYAYYAEIILNTDPLTRLLNRRCYENRCAVLRVPMMVFYFDVDDFKSVNDTYGHATGDEVLIAVGAMLREIYGKKGRCYRVGGDEFSALVDIREDEVQAHNEAFNRLFAARRAEDPRLTGVSIGSAFYDPKLGTFSDAVAAADKTMYQCKNRHKHTEGAT